MDQNSVAIKQLRALGVDINSEAAQSFLSLHANRMDTLAARAADITGVKVTSRMDGGCGWGGPRRTYSIISADNNESSRAFHGLARSSHAVLNYIDSIRR